jgi:[ribosomal protein S18]-alanine N-acetyltransferase
MNHKLILPKPAPPLQLTELTASDLEQLHSLEQAANPHPWSRANLASSLASNHQCWGLWSAPELLGYLVFSLNRYEAEILQFTIARTHQGKGLGRWLLQSALDALSGVTEQIFLEVRPSNTTAIGLYESLGFNQVGVRPHYYRNGQHSEDAWIYGLALPQESAAHDHF